MAARKDPLRHAIAERLALALERSLLTQDEFLGEVSFSPREWRAYLSTEKGEPRAPGPSRLVELASVLEVSPSWILTGRDELPSSYAAWLESRPSFPAARERAFLRSLPLDGYRAPVAFWDQALAAYHEGQHRSHTLREIVEMARRAVSAPRH